MTRNLPWATATVAAAALLGTTIGGANAAGPAHGQEDWPRWQGRLTLGAASAPLRLGAHDRNASRASLSLMGDYYFARPGWALIEQGGFRATSGLVLGHGARSLLTLGTPSSAQPLRLQARQRSDPWSAWPAGTAPDSSTHAYVGLGYTGVSRGGWGFSADVGLLSHDGHAARLGRAAAGNDGLDDALRALRLAPLVQLGVSYAF